MTIVEYADDSDLKLALIMHRLYILYGDALKEGIKYTDESRLRIALTDEYNSNYSDISKSRLSNAINEFLKQESFRREHSEIHSYRLWYIYAKTIYEEIESLYHLHYRPAYTFFKWIFDETLGARHIHQIPYSTNKWKNIFKDTYEFSDSHRIGFIIRSATRSKDDQYSAMKNLDELYGYNPHIPRQLVIQILIKHILLYDKKHRRDYD